MTVATERADRTDAERAETPIDPPQPTIPDPIPGSPPVPPPMPTPGEPGPAPPTQPKPVAGPVARPVARRRRSTSTFAQRFLVLE